MRDDYIAIESEGLRFRFYFDREDVSALHIYVQHGMGIPEALTVFFEGEAEWNEERKRFESRLGNRTLFWAWKRRQEEIIVITCFEGE